MNSLHSTPITILPAPGANKVIIVTSMMLFVTRDSSTAQTNSACDFYAGYNGATVVSESLAYIRRFMLNETGSRMLQATPGSYEAGQSITAGDNQTLTVALDSAVTTGSIDSMKVVFSYYIFDNS